MWLERLKAITSEEIINKLKNTHVLIIGLGGVGSYATEAIIRSGVGEITIVDCDVIDETNLNRQLMTNTSNIGNFKTEEIKKRALSINKEININVINAKILPSNIDLLYKGNPDFIIDACDTVTTKKEIIRQSLKRNVKFISSMGTANKFDPTKLEIIDVRKTSYDPIAKIIRKMVKDERIKGKIPVVCSTEKKAVNTTDVLGSNSFVPGTSGLICASYVINTIRNEEIQ